MKIGFVLDDSLDTPDGVQQYILTLGKWLKDQGHTVAYLVGETNRTDTEQVYSLARNVKVRFNGNRMSMPLPAHRANIQKLLEREQFNVLHVQMPYSPFMAGRVITAAPLRTAVVGTFHIAPYTRFEQLATRVLGIAVRSTLRRFDKVLAVSTAAQDCAQQSFRVASTVVPNAVDMRLFARAATQRPDGMHIVFLGRLVERKGCMHLLAALQRLHATGQLRDVQVTIAGRGPEEGPLRAFVQQHGLAEIVTFRGFVDEADKPALLASADIAVFPSTSGESFGIVLIEAMAAGAGVVIGGDNVGYRTVLDNRPDMLFDPTDTNTFADKLQKLCSSKKLQAQLHAWQQQRVKLYDIQTVGPQLVTEYQAALQLRHAKKQA